MAIETVNKEELRKAMKEVMNEVLAEAVCEYKRECQCRIDIDDKEAEQVKFMFSAIKEIGDGSLEKGIVEVRDNHKFITKYKKWTGNIGTASITFIIIGIISIVGKWLATIAKG